MSGSQIPEHKCVVYLKNCSRWLNYGTQNDMIEKNDGHILNG